MHLYTLKHQLTLTFKTLKKLLKNLLVTLPLHVSVHSFDHPQGVHIPCFVLLLDGVPLICVRWLFVQYVLVVSVVCVAGALVRVRSGYGVHNQISPWQEDQPHTQTDGKQIQPHTAQTINERKSAEPNLVTAQSTAYEPPEDGRMSGPKHVGVTSLKGFLTVFFSVLNVNVSWCFKVYKCMSWNKQQCTFTLF